MTVRRFGTAALLAAVALLVAGCGTGAVPIVTPSPSSLGSGTASATPGDTASPDSGVSDTASPDPSGTPESTPDAGSIPTPVATLADPTAGASDQTPGATIVPAGCAGVTLLRVGNVTSDPSRTTEVVTVVSDGKSITSGTREQTEFLTPTLVAPDQSQITDEATTKQVAALIGAAGKNRVLLTRPEGPDATASANRRPFNAAGTYVLFNASAPLEASVIVQCGGQEQTWSFTAEADPSSGQVNCAVEPSKSNAIARVVYLNNCPS